MSKRRNNSERTGAPHQDAPTPPPPTTTSQSTDIFSFINPTEFVDLPSKGLLYPEEHPLHKQGTLEIRHMTAKEEDILTSEALIKKGIALDRLVNSLIVDKSVTTENLLIGDKNAVLMAARITGFGSDYSVAVTCPSCDAAWDEQIDLNLIEAKMGETDVEGVRLLENGNYEMEFAEYEGLTIEVRLLRGIDERNIVSRREKKRKMKLPDSLVTDQLGTIIVRVNDITEPTLLQEFVGRCPTRISRELRVRYEQLVPDIDMTLELDCDMCGHTEKVGMPLTAEFFWPNS